MSKKYSEEMRCERDDLYAKVNNLENRLFNLQQELNKKERDSFNTTIAENTEKHLTHLCQTLTTQLEDVKMQLRISEDKCRRLESEQNNRSDKLDAYMFAEPS
jgi:hypothetical protein